jgi:DNA-binding NtrC family response regulator
MTRILVVHRERDVADDQAESLRRAGYVVQECAGPTCGPCPIMKGLPCAAVHDADVLVYDAWSTGESDGGRILVEQLRERHPEIPIVLTAAGAELDWVETSGVHAVVPLVGIPTGPPLLAAVEQALASVGVAAVVHS